MHILPEHIHILKAHIKYTKVTILTEGRRKCGLKGSKQGERVNERQTLRRVGACVTLLHPVPLSVYLYFLLSPTPQCDYMLNAFTAIILVL